MADRIVVDPITRIEGHLRVEAKIGADNKIEDAFSSGTAVRGIELVIKDRDPRDAWAYAQRICGVCTTTHALSSVRAVEHALDIKVPIAGHLVRNVIYGAQMLHDHIVHFYHLHALDWVDVVSAASADPSETARLAQSLSSWPKASAGYFKDIQAKIIKLVETNQLGIFANGYWGHSAYKLPKEVNLLAVAHYLEALDWQKDVVKIHTILGGKNPHPHYVVGGMATPLAPDIDNSINTTQLLQIKDYVDNAYNFTNQVYMPDIMAIASFYKDTAAYGGGIQNFLAFGDYSPTDPHDVKSFRFKRGAILNGDLTKVHDLDLNNKEEIQEFVDQSWYTYDGNDKGKGKHPYEGETTFKYTGPNEEKKELDVSGKYSWVKSPRWKGNPMEVGPLARMVINYAAGDSATKEVVDSALTQLDVPISALFSVLGRTAARALESKLIADWLVEDMNALLSAVKNGNTTTVNVSKKEPSTWPKKSKGVGMVEAPRGGLSHWVVIEDSKIKNYQAIVPSTWNASPRREGADQIAPYEASLIGTPVANKEQPLEIIRVIHSFDPCLACAVHLTDLENKEATVIKID